MAKPKAASKPRSSRSHQGWQLPRDLPSKEQRGQNLLPVIKEARAVVRARKRPGGLAEEAMHTARLQEALRHAERANDFEDWSTPARRISAAILKEAKSRQVRLFNPAKGALVWDNFHKWTAQVVRCWQQKDEYGTWETCTLRRVGNPPPGTFTPGINVGDTYDIESNRVKIVPQKALGHGWKQPKENPKVTACYVTSGWLHNYQTGESLRRATKKEEKASEDAARHDGGSGVIHVALKSSGKGNRYTLGLR